MVVVSYLLLTLIRSTCFLFTSIFFGVMVFLHHTIISGPEIVWHAVCIYVRAEYEGSRQERAVTPPAPGGSHRVSAGAREQNGAARRLRATRATSKTSEKAHPIHAQHETSEIRPCADVRASEKVRYTHRLRDRWANFVPLSVYE